MSVNDIMPAVQAGLAPDQPPIVGERAPKARLPEPLGVSSAARPREERPDGLPLSFEQERIWHLGLLGTGGAAGPLCRAARLRGELDLPALERSLRELVRRHEILRTHIRSVDGRPQQVIAAEREVPLPTVDLSAEGGGPADCGLERRLRDEAERPFNPASGDLFRALLVRLGPSDHVFMVSMHPIVADGPSLDLLLRELWTCYSAFREGGQPALPALTLQFADHALRERSLPDEGERCADLGYWRERLDGSSPALDFPGANFGSTPAPGPAESLSLALPSALAEPLGKLGQECDATPFMIHLAAFVALLHRYAGQDDIVVGSPTPGRRQPEFDGVAGPFADTVVFRTKPEGGLTFREWLGRVRTAVSDALAHQALPFARLVEQLRPERHLVRQPLFRVMFALEEPPPSAASLVGLEVRPLDLPPDVPRCDLMLVVAEGIGGSRVRLEYDRDRYSESVVHGLLASYRTLLEGIAADHGRRIDEYALTDSGVRRQVLSEWSGQPATRSATPSIGELFAEQAARRPKAVALEQGGRRITYEQLQTRAGRLALRLRRAGVSADQPVVVALDRSPEYVIALLGVLLAGGAYAVIDPSAQPDPLVQALGELQASVVVTSAGLRERLSVLTARMPGPAAGPDFVLVDEPGGDSSDGAAPDTGGVAVAPNQMAYVAWVRDASGSGEGVCVEHRSVVGLVRDSAVGRFSSEDVVLLHASPSFDPSTFELWGALLNGARLVLAPPGEPSTAELGECVARHQVTVLRVSARLLGRLVDEPPARLKGVRLLLLGDGVASPVHVRRAREVLPGATLVNGYGRPETATLACVDVIRETPALDQPVPVGRPVANAEVYILDRLLQPVPPGVPGELCIGGDILARGYWRQLRRTLSRFVAHPFRDEPGGRLFRTGDRARWRGDGRIEFLGRTDRQVKICGFPVDLGVVEDCLVTHPAVRQAAIMTANGESTGRRLVAFVVIGPPTPAGEALREYLAGRLPAHMVPSDFVRVDALPVLADGSVDYAHLPVGDSVQPRPAGETPAPPRDALERRLAGLWEQVLGQGPVDMEASFFDLGGHSLLAVRLLALVEKSFGRRLPPTSMVQHCTVREMARLLRPDPDEASSLVPIQPKGSRPPLFLVHGVGGGMFWGYANLSRGLGQDQPVFAFRSRGLDGLPERGSIGEMAERYVSDLRAFQPVGPYRLGGYCFGGVIAYEMARQLRAQGEETSLLALIDCAPPNTDYSLTRRSWSPRWMGRFLVNLGFWGYSFLHFWSPAERRGFVRWKFRVLGRRFQRLVRSGSGPDAPDVEQMVDLAPYSGDQRRLWESHVRLLLTHRPGPYEGGVTLFRTRGHPMFCSFEHDYGWGELVTGGVAVKIIDGCHGNMLDEPHVQGVAAKLAQCLRDAAEPARQEDPSPCARTI